MLHYNTLPPLNFALPGHSITSPDLTSPYQDTTKQHCTSPPQYDTTPDLASTVRDTTQPCHTMTLPYYT